MLPTFLSPGKAKYISSKLPQACGYATYDNAYHTVP